MFARFFSTMSQVHVKKATFGGGCFWGVEKYFRQQFKEGLVGTRVGYCGGDVNNPSYEDVCTGTTNHAEVVQLDYDESIVSYEQLLNFFWRMHDPTTPNRQGNDRGTQYRSVVFYHSPEQEAAAKKVLAEMQASGKFSAPIVTQIVPAGEYYNGEDYHQRYLEKNPGGYCNHKIRF